MNNHVDRIRGGYRMEELRDPPEGGAGGGGGYGGRGYYSRGTGSHPVGTDAPFPVTDAPYPGAPMDSRYGSMPLGAGGVTGVLQGEIPTTLPEDGCLLLGKEETQKGIRYVYSTRFYVGSRNDQRKYVSQEVIREIVTPCCDPEYSSTCGGQIWGFLRSEFFLFSLQVAALIMGLFKILAFQEIKEEDKDRHLSHAVIETSFACIYVIIRSFVSKEKFHVIKEVRMRNEYVRMPKDSRSHLIKIWVYIQFLIGFTMCCCIVSSFVLCYLYDKMGWILLSNQLVMLISAFLTSLTMHRLNHMINRIKEDQHKIVIHEAALLLGELYWSQTEGQRSKAKHHVERFCKGLKMSSSFYRPEYIMCPEDLDWDIVTNMESGV